MPRITEVGNQASKGGTITLDDGTTFTFGVAPEPIFHLGGCYVFVSEDQLILSDCVIAHISGNNVLIFEDDKFVFQAIQEFRRRGKENVGDR